MPYSRIVTSETTPFCLYTAILIAGVAFCGLSVFPSDPLLHVSGGPIVCRHHPTRGIVPVS